MVFQQNFVGKSGVVPPFTPHAKPCKRALEQKRVWLARKKIRNALVKLMVTRRCENHTRVVLGNGVGKRNREELRG